MNSIISNSLKRSASYQDYRTLVKKLTEENSSTGNEKTDDMAGFTKLNDQRMKRWDKTLKVSEPAQNIIKEFEHDITWLVIIESWCGDGAHMLPVLNKLASLNNHINLKIVLRDENPELMDLFLTFGSRSVPKLIMIDNEREEVIDSYGPRPSEATSFVNRYKAMYGTLTPEFKEDLQHWYNNDKGQNIIKDVIEILCKFEPIVCQ